MSTEKRAINPWFIAVTVTLATFMELLDTSIANVALPYIGGGLGRSYDEVTWILTTYLVANAVILPMSAWLSRVFGRRTFYLGCVALFTLTSLFCGLAPTLGIMLSSRVLQGIAGGGLAPVSQAILVDTFPPAKRASAFALYTIVIVTAPAIGPVLGGWITDNYTWRWIFFINIPIGFVAFFLSSRLLKDPPAFEAERASVRTNGKLHIDGTGITLIALASAALEIALDRGQIDDWFGSSFICWMLAIGVIGWIATVAWELRSKEPVIDFRLLASRNFAIASVLFFVFGFGLFGSTTLIPQILQSLYGYRAIDAGLVLGPGALVITLFAPIAAQLIQRQIVPARVLLTISMITVGAAMWYYSTFTLATDYTHYALARAFQGLGYGFFFVPVNVLAYSQLRADQNNRASSLTNLFRNWGGSFGIAFIDKHRIGNWGNFPTASGQDHCADQLFRDEGLLRSGRRDGRPGLPLPAVAASGESVVLHGLFPGDRVADSGRGPAIVIRPRFQTGRKIACGSLSAAGERQDAFDPYSYFRGIGIQ